MLSLTDQIAIMRDGELVRVSNTAEETVDTLVSGMVGKSLATEYAGVHRAQDRPVRMSVQGLTRLPVVQDVSLEIRSGEILGLAGLIGSGRTEIARCIFGADRPDAGELHIDGEPVPMRSPKSAIARGIFMVPESRKEQGLVLGSSIADNLTLASLSRLARAGLISGRKIRSIGK